MSVFLDAMTPGGYGDTAPNTPAASGFAWETMLGATMGKALDRWIDVATFSNTGGAATNGLNVVQPQPVSQVKPGTAPAAPAAGLLDTLKRWAPLLLIGAAVVVVVTQVKK